MYVIITDQKYVIVKCFRLNSCLRKYKLYPSKHYTQGPKQCSNTENLYHSYKKQFKRGKTLKKQSYNYSELISTFKQQINTKEAKATSL